MLNTKIVKKLSYSLSANLLSFFISIIMVVILPKVISIIDYGAWQLYLFYTSYVCCLSFGLSDGMYLRYAGRKYQELDRKVFAGQIYLLLVFTTIVSSILFIWTCLCVKDYIMKIVLISVSICVVFNNFYNICTLIFQFTNQIEIYAKRMAVEKISMITLILILFMFGYCHVESLLVGHIFSILLASGISAWSIRTLLCPSFPSVIEIYYEAKKNIVVGLSLMLANTAGILILGVIRYGIADNWSVSVFGKVSLTLSIANFFLVAINAASVVLFPMLKRLDKNQLRDIYLKLRILLTVVSFGMLLLYYPISVAFNWWLPEYMDSLVYMVILFPVGIFQSRINLLINTCLKSIRKERMMLLLNGAAFLFAGIMTLLGGYILHNLNVMVVAIVASFAFWCIISEVYLSRVFRIDLISNIICEGMLIIIFIISSWYFDHKLGLIVYGLSYMLYVFMKRKEMIKAILWIK